MKIRNIKLNLIIFVGLLILSFAVFAYAQNNSSSDKNIFLDTDQDGLSDEEEKMYGTDSGKSDTDGDGYTDGAEVKSGYDPTKPAPGDKIISPKPTVSKSAENTASTPLTDDAEAPDNTENATEEKNLTKEFSAKVAALVSDSSEEQQDISLQDIDTMIQEITSNTLAYEDLPAISDEEIKIKKQKYKSLPDSERLAKEKEDALEYLTTVCYILANNSPRKLTDPKDLEDLSKDITDNVSKLATNFSDISYFENLADKGAASLEQLKEVEVSENLKDTHKRGLQLLTYATSLNDTTKFKADDPIYNILNISKVQSLMSLSAEFTTDVNAQFKELGISEIPLNL
jgi:hypothetical protein